MSYRSLTFAYFKPHPGLNIDFAFKALQKLAIFRYGGYESEAVSDKWLYETKEEEGESRNQGNKLRPDNNCSRKDMSAKAAHMVQCFWRKCSAVSDPE